MNNENTKMNKNLKFEVSYNNFLIYNLKEYYSIEYEEKISSNPCNLMIGEQLVHSLSPPLNCSRLITSSTDYIAYTISSRVSMQNIVKIHHIQSREYYVLKSFKGNVVSICLNPNDLLGIIDNSGNIKIYSIMFNDNLINCNEIYTEDLSEYLLPTNLLFNQSKDDQFLITWNKNHIYIIEILQNNTFKKMDFNQTDNISALSISNSGRYLVYLSESSTLYVFEKKPYRNDVYDMTYTNIHTDKEFIKEITLINSDDNSSILLFWNSAISIRTISGELLHHIIFLNITDYLIPCNFLQNGYFPIIDKTNKILINFHIDTKSFPYFKDMYALPFNSSTRGFLYEFNQNNEFIIYDYYINGLRTYTINYEKDKCLHSNDESIKFNNILSILNNVSTTLPITKNNQLNSNIKIFHSCDIEENNLSDESSISQQNNSNHIINNKTEVLNSFYNDTIQHFINLKKYIADKMDESNYKLISSLSRENNISINTLQHPRDYQNIQNNLKQIEIRLKCIENNHINLIKKLEDAQNLQNKNQKNNTDNIFNELCLRLDKVDNSIKCVKSSQDNHHLITTLKSHFNEAFENHISQQIKIHLEPLFFKLSTNFETGTREYLKSVGSHLDKFISTNVLNQKNFSQAEFSIVLNEFLSKTKALLNSFVNDICLKLDTKISDIINTIPNVQNIYKPIDCTKDIELLISKNDYVSAFKMSVQNNNSIFLIDILFKLKPTDLFNDAYLTKSDILSFIQIIVNCEEPLNEYHLICEHLCHALYIIKENTDDIIDSDISLLRLLHIKLNKVKLDLREGKSYQITLVLCLIDSILIK